jgi:polysaccharide biosynthesis/export protein
MNIQISRLITALALSILLASCASSKKITYMQIMPANTDTLAAKSKSSELYEAHIKPKDILSITVVTSASDASRIYNLLVPQIAEMTNATYSAPTMQTYMVNNDGNIHFPIFGEIKAAGLSRKELEAELQKLLDPEFSKEQPIITIRITNYSVSIIGEVSKPGKYITNNERLTLFEGLALAGDMTIYGKRDNVKILRESANGSKTIIPVNLNDKNIINSPAYFLEQNDIVYVEPNKARSRTANIGTAETLGVSAATILISLSSLIINILK